MSRQKGKNTQVSFQHFSIINDKKMDIKIPLNREDQEKENCAVPIVVSPAHREKNSKVETEWL